MFSKFLQLEIAPRSANRLALIDGSLSKSGPKPSNCENKFICMRIKATFISEIVLTLVSVQKHQSFFYVLSTPHGKKNPKI